MTGTPGSRLKWQTQPGKITFRLEIGRELSNNPLMLRLLDVRTHLQRNGQCDESLLLIQIGLLVGHLVAASLPAGSQEPRQVRLVQPNVQKRVAIKRSARWSAKGRVIDGDGKPIGGVAVTASTGIGTLIAGGQGQTDNDGKHEFAFGPGIHFADDDVQMQFATISASKPGYFV